ncbi:hypothetical protein B9Z55_024401 [Caenorhabditis nigoni]|uniref:Uncharacterized protein n=1 Tax=Caenorhabditis nigoni TaxID=1611254 RepID=A0A2G5SUL4_9PELO|nr:hypothetical protein B9Z55_024401 [Caenorhabditis nigoni]
MSSGSTSSHDTSLFREDVDRFLMNTVNNYPYYNHSENGDGEPGFSPYIESAWLDGFMSCLDYIPRMTTQEKVENWLETSSIHRFVQNNEPST